jgi:hypothetical protein
VRTFRNFSEFFRSPANFINMLGSIERHRLRSALTRDHCGAKQKLAGSRRICRDAAQFVEVFVTYCGIAFLKSLFVGN